MKILAKKIIKYITISILGAVLFALSHRAVMPERPAGGIGGEVLLLGLPLFWWIVERTVKDLLRDFKHERRENKNNRMENIDD